MLGVRVDDGQTRIMTFARSADFTLEDRAHCLELIEGHDSGHRFILGPAGASIGRSAHMPRVPIRLTSLSGCDESADEAVWGSCHVESSMASAARRIGSWPRTSLRERRPRS